MCGGGTHKVVSSLAVGISSRAPCTRRAREARKSKEVGSVGREVVCEGEIYGRQTISTPEGIFRSRSCCSCSVASEQVIYVQDLAAL